MLIRNYKTYYEINSVIIHIKHMCVSMFNDAKCFDGK